VPTLDVLLGAFGAGVYLIVALTHLDLWVRRRERTGHLWLALASASALLVDVTGIALAFAATAEPALLGLNTFGVAGATAALLELVSALARAPTGKWSRRLQVATLACAPLTAVLPSLSSAVLVSCGILVGVSVTRAVRAARLDPDSRVVSRAFLILAACLIADLVKELFSLPIPDNLPLAGFTILFLAAAHSLNDRFEREHEASRRDALTGLPNRRGFLESWEEALQRNRRSGRPVSVVLGDLDHFKRINDTHGHACGDTVLRAVAQAIRSCLRAQDVVSRWGGEEFMLLLPDTDLAGAGHVAETTRLAVRALRVEHPGPAFQVTISLGVCEHRPGRSMEETIAEADAALYRAKQEGRDRVVAR
jgi:diguanylate cyclase (GGDEF)-like protein